MERAMKRSWLGPALTALCLTFVACSDDDDGTETAGTSDTNTPNTDSAVPPASADADNDAGPENPSSPVREAPPTEAPPTDNGQNDSPDLDEDSVRCTGNRLSPGTTTRQITVDGLERSYILAVPEGYTGDTPLPLVLDFHGATMTASAQQDTSGYADLVDRENILVAWPDGLDNVRNAGPCCSPNPDEVDDVAFARAIVEEIEAEGCIDAQRVYATGYSNGGGLALRLGCEAADMFAAIAPGAFDLLEGMPCDPSRPITMISFRGTADPIVSYEPAETVPPNGDDRQPIRNLGAEGTFVRWAELNDCEGEPEDIGEGCRSYEACSADVEVTLCTEVGGVHSPPDAERAWATLQQYQLP